MAYFAAESLNASQSVASPSNAVAPNSVDGAGPATRGENDDASTDCVEPIRIRANCNGFNATAVGAGDIRRSYGVARWSPNARITANGRNAGSDVSPCAWEAPPRASMRPRWLITSSP